VASSPRRPLLLLAAAFLLAAPFGAVVRPAAAAATAGGCGEPGYSYAGVASSRGVHGVAASISQLAPAQIGGGHVAAWVGVSSLGALESVREWIQVGVASTASGAGELYVERTAAGGEPQYTRLGPTELGRSYRLAVAELPHRPGTWQAYVDGRPAGPSLYLADSSGSFPGVATAENWRAGSGCNAFHYRFRTLQVRGRLDGGWQPLPHGQRYQDDGYRLRMGRDGFLAASA
jgi:hypothetical protein